ncbi:MAG: aminopeptidase P family protein [Acetobacteraceae bacterium]|nr:aminopeptidase P family protein [Acetobacteraceae bacterium]
MADTDTDLRSASMPAAPPFSTSKLDGLLDDAGIDVLVVTSKHNIRYLLGGHANHFFSHMDAIGISRYLPVLVYPKGRPHDAAYIANRNETGMLAVRHGEGRPLWVATVRPEASGTEMAMRLAVDHLRKRGVEGKVIGVEAPFLPVDAARLLQDAFPSARLTDAYRPLELLRAVKSPGELATLRQASERVVDAMLAVIREHGPGTTKRALQRALRRAETERDLTFEYALITVGRSHNRAPSDEVWMEGDVLSLDSGGNLDGYIGDLCRMGILGEPDAELEDCLGEIDRVQMAARGAIRPGAPGGDIYEAVRPILAASSFHDLDFVAHGIGLISHEAPRLTATGPVPYPDSDAARPLAAGMVVSIETTLPHPRRGYIKLEDTVAVTADGAEGYGDAGRGWNRGGR